VLRNRNVYIISDGYLLTIFKKIINSDQELLRFKKRIVRQIADKLIVIDNDTGTKATVKRQQELVQYYYESFYKENYRYDVRGHANNKSKLFALSKDSGIFNMMNFYFMIDFISFIITNLEIDFLDGIVIGNKNGLQIDFGKELISVFNIDKLKSLSKSTPEELKNYDNRN